jgi:hypothetical protein
MSRDENKSNYDIGSKLGPLRGLTSKLRYWKVLLARYRGSRRLPLNRYFRKLCAMRTDQMNLNIKHRGFRYLGGVVQLLIVSILYCAALTPGMCAQEEEDLTRPNVNGAPTPVQVKLYLADLFEISGSEQTFVADVVMIAEWQDPRLAGRWTGRHGADLNDVWHPRFQLVNQRGVTSLLPQVLEIDPTGHVLYRQRWTGRFSARMDLRDFPFDQQQFHIQVISLGYTRDQVDLIPYTEGKMAVRAKQLSISDWSVGPARMQSADYEQNPGLKPRAGVELKWDASRELGYYTVQIILPLIMIVLMGWTALWIELNQITVRMSVVVTTMLTIIAYRFALARLVPNLTYLTRFDYFTLGSTVLIFLTLLTVAASAALISQDKKEIAQRINHWAVFLYPVFYASVLLLWWKWI